MDHDPQLTRLPEASTREGSSAEQQTFSFTTGHSCPYPLHGKPFEASRR